MLGGRDCLITRKDSRNENQFYVISNFHKVYLTWVSTIVLLRNGTFNTYSTVRTYIYSETVYIYADKRTYAGSIIPRYAAYGIVHFIMRL